MASSRPRQVEARGSVREPSTDLARSSPAGPASGALTRASEALASPLSIVIVLPSLVLVVGVVLTLLADTALRGSNLDVVRDRLSDQGQTVADMVSLALRQADPMLDRLAGLAQQHGPEQPFEAFAHSLADLMQDRPGVAYVSVSFPDGTFQGAYLDHGALQFQDSRLGQDRTRVRRYALDRRGALALLAEEESAYDPRQRDFYKRAVRARRSVWTDPYPFYRTHVTGITRARPLYRDPADPSSLQAVLTVDYDVQALSRFLHARRLSGVRAVLYANDGAVLAYAGEGGESLPLPAGERTLRFSDLTDPVLLAFYAQARERGADAVGMRRVVVGAEPFLAVVVNAAREAGLGWSVAYLAPERAFLSALHRYERQSLWASGVVLLVALGVAWLFARHVTRARREMAVARAEAARARQEVRELGSYRLVSCLGKGGMGEVWRAEHRLLAREAAIKLIQPSDNSGVTSAELKLRFRREAEALSALRSRHTIELFDYGVADDGTFFFVMELLDGMDLETLVARHGAQPTARVVPLLLQVCASLAEAHAAGLVHRDIKPANIFVCRAADELDVVKVLDFGIVRTVARADEQPEQRALAAGGEAGTADLTLSGGALGTPGFMPPEQALGHDIDGRADLYALGCVAVWLLCGRLLFEHENPMHRMIARLTEELPDLDALLPGVPAALRALIHACLSRAPDGRPASARALAKALRAIPLDAGAWSQEIAEAWWQEHAVVRRGPSASQPPPTPRTLIIANERPTS